MWVLTDYVISVLLTQREEPVNVQTLRIKAGTGESRNCHHQSTRTGKKPGRTTADFAEALNGHSRPRQGHGEELGGRPRRLDHTKAGQLILQRQAVINLRAQTTIVPARVAIAEWLKVFF